METETTPKTHVVVGIISRLQGNTKQYLLISSKKDFSEFTGFYYPPGGHLEIDENEKSALIREVREEIGIKPKPIEKIAESPSDVKNQITHWWLCEADTSKILVDETEIQDIKWFTKEEILTQDKIWPATKQFFKEHVSP